MFATPPARSVPPESRMLVVPAVIGLAIAVGATLFGPIDTALERAPIALLGGASFAFGGVLAWAFRRWRSR